MPDISQTIFIIPEGGAEGNYEYFLRCISDVYPVITGLYSKAISFK